MSEVEKPETEVKESAALPGIIGGILVVLVLLGAIGVFGWVTGVVEVSDPNQATMPEEFIKGVMIERMTEGDRGWVGTYDVRVDANRKVWISDSSTVLSQKDESNEIEVYRNKGYFEITILPDMKWELSAGSYQVMGYLRVSRVSVGEEEKEVEE
jgi:hypothetical protein